MRFRIAETLGMTVADLEHKMTDYELYQWSAYFEFKAEIEKKALDEAKRKNR